MHATCVCSVSCYVGSDRGRPYAPGCRAHAAAGSARAWDFLCKQEFAGYL
jgi:hypothetical protein